MTIGTDRVRIDFNPSNDRHVAAIKMQVAALIDLCEERKHHVAPGNPQSEANRLWALAMTAFEEGGMWAVKATTAGKP